MQSNNTKSMSRAALIVILMAYFICLGLARQDIYAAQVIINKAKRGGYYGVD